MKISSLKTITPVAICLFVILAVSGCMKDNDFGSNTNVIPGNQGGGQQGGGTTGSSATIAGLTDFTVDFNTTALSETETIPSGDLDYVENASFDGTVNINYNGSTATVDGGGSNVTVSGADVTVSGGSYKIYLTGSTTDGSLNITVKKDQAIYLNGVSITNPDGAAIGNAKKGFTTYVVAVDGTENTLTDGSTRAGATEDTPEYSDYKGAFFTKGKAVFSGKGSLKVNGNYKNGLHVKQDCIIRPNSNIYVALANTIEKGSCIKCATTTACLNVRGGVLNLDNPTKAGKGLSADGNLTVSGGRITAICSGEGMWDETDVSGSAGIKCDSVFSMTGGDLELKSTGAGGKGINGDSILNFNGGTVHVITTGQTYKYSSGGYTYDTSPKGIKCDRIINVTDGSIYVRATGTSDGSEGVESKGSYNQTGGSVMVYAADDALNAGYSSETDQGEMTLAQKIAAGLVPSDAKANQGQVNVSGGTLYVYSESNDAMDSNGTISISGGNVIAFGAGAPETSIDCDQDNKLSVTGGNIFGLGGAAPNTPGAACTQCYAVIGSFTSTANTTYTLKNASGTEIMSVEVPRAYQGGSLVVSSPDMAKGTTYTIGETSFTTSTDSWITSSTGSGTGGGSLPGGGDQPGGGQPGPGTGIDTVTSNTQDLTSDAIYDMTGRRLSAIPSRGMYIRNGKKFIVR